MYRDPWKAASYSFLIILSKQSYKFSRSIYIQ